jgi:hypothetical protein
MPASRFAQILLAGLAACAALAFAPSALADDRDRHRDGYYDRGYHDDRGHRGRGWDDDDRHAYRKGYERGRREAERYPYGGRPYGYGDRHHDRYYGYSDHSPRYGHRSVTIVVPIGGYFDHRYGAVVEQYYGRPCRRYGDWRGEWRRPYAVGYALPPHVHWRPVEPDLYRVLPRAPVGYSYVSVDRDVLLIAEASKRVIDAIVIASAR